MRPLSRFALAVCAGLLVVPGTAMAEDRLEQTGPVVSSLQPEDFPPAPGAPLDLLARGTATKTTKRGRSCQSPFRVTVRDRNRGGDTRRIRVTVGDFDDDTKSFPVRWRTIKDGTRKVVMCEVRRYFYTSFNPDGSFKDVITKKIPTGPYSGHADISYDDVPDGWNSYTNFTARYAKKSGHAASTTTYRTNLRIYAGYFIGRKEARGEIVRTGRDAVELKLQDACTPGALPDAVTCQLVITPRKNVLITAARAQLRDGTWTTLDIPQAGGTIAFTTRPHDTYPYRQLRITSRPRPGTHPEVPRFKSLVVKCPEGGTTNNGLDPMAGDSRG